MFICRIGNGKKVYDRTVDNIVGAEQDEESQDKERDELHNNWGSYRAVFLLHRDFGK
jgi:hypothetical protein